MSKPAVWSLERLADEPLGRVVIWASPHVRQRVAERFSWPIVDPVDVPRDADTLLVVGGGTLMDHAKAQRHDLAPSLRLIAIPSIWGSGAEASPVVVTTHPDRKAIRVDESFLPDVRVIWPELAASLPAALARYGCGDCWAHALEGFLCPLAHDDVRRDIAPLIAELLTLPLANDPRWFEVSARACAAQARSGVGLVHGIAHVLEPVLRAAQPDAQWGHARLCSLFLWPVLRLNVRSSTKARDLAQSYAVDLAEVDDRARELFDERDYTAALPLLAANWSRILRDPCSRTNCTLVRGEHLAFFQERAFL